MVRHFLKRLFQHRISKLEPRHKWNALEAAISFSVANNVVGDYLEFGVYKGDSFTHAYGYHRDLIRRYRKLNPGRSNSFLEQNLRYFAFDSFQGLPQTDDTQIPLHWRGERVFAYPRDHFERNLRSAGVDAAHVEIIEGFYEDVLTKETVENTSLTQAAIINVDCDLFDSARLVMDFITPFIVDGTVIYFDDWFYYNGHPRRGERGALNAWLEQHAEFSATPLATYSPAAALVINVT